MIRKTQAHRSCCYCKSGLVYPMNRHVGLETNFNIKPPYFIDPVYCCDNENCNGTINEILGEYLPVSKKPPLGGDFYMSKKPRRITLKFSPDYHVVGEV